MKKFFSTQDIEDLAAQGKTELIVDENTVLTDLARHTADQLGITVVHRSHAVAPLPAATPAPRVPAGPAGKPKGCQHGPLAGQPAANPAPPNTVVDQLVGLVKRLGNRGGGDSAGG